MASRGASFGAVGVVLGALLAGACSSDPAQSAPADASTEKSPPPTPDSGAPAVTGPAKLSETGLFADFAQRTLADGVRAYAPKYPFWSDGDAVQRWLYLPPNTKIDTVGMDDWTFPVGTKAWLQITVNGTLMETRFLWKARADAWFQVAYAWLADGSDAVAAPDGVDDAQGTTHEILPRKDCIECHDQVIDQLIGVSAIQLSDGGKGLLSTLIAEGRLTQPPPGEFTIPGNDVERAALGYLHGNCGNCHNAFSKLDKQTTMRLRVLTSETTAASASPYQTSLGVKMMHEIPPDITQVLVPGDPDRSGIFVRVDRRDAYGMPPEGTKVVDPQGSAAVRAWIEAMAPVADGGAD